jgi:hypothetical protein
VVQEFSNTTSSIEGLALEIVSQITLNAVSLLDLKVTGIQHPVDYHYDGQKIQLCWQTPIAAGEKRRVSFEYHVQNPVQLPFQLGLLII